MKIAIDARAASHPQPGGFKTYTENLLRHLPCVAGEAEIVCYFDRPYHFEQQTQARVISARPALVGVVRREQWAVPRQALADQVDLLHFPCSTGARFCRVPVVVTIHDLIGWRQRPRFGDFPPLERVKRLCMWCYGRWAVSWAAEQAGRIITDSSFSASEINRLLGVPASGIDVVYPAPAERFQWQPDRQAEREVLKRHGIASPFLLAMGSADARKNMGTLIQAYAGLSEALRSRFPLVIVWTHGALTARMREVIDKHCMSDRVHFLSQVSDQDLVALYNAATLFVFPTLAEGFGLPPLEAMACGTPVVASNTTSLPEVLGRAAILVEPTNVQAISEAMAAVLTDTSLQSSLRERGLERSQEFSWTRTARETLAVYERAVREGHRG